MSEDVNRISVRKFSELSAREKLVFVCKALVFLLSGGFIYPRLWIE